MVDTLTTWLPVTAHVSADGSFHSSQLPLAAPSRRKSSP